MFRSIPFSFLAVFILIICSKGLAANFGIGFATSLPSSPIDHFKFGPSLSLYLFEKSKWHFKGSAELISISLSPVNPGAVPSSSAPDQSETNAASTVFLGEAWLEAPTSLFGGNLSFGNISYFPDFSRAPVIGVPTSIAAQILWKLFGKQDSRLRSELSVSAGVNPLSDLTIAGLTELAFIAKLSNTFSMRISGKGIVVRGQETQTLIHLIPSLRIVTHF